VWGLDRLLRCGRMDGVSFRRCLARLVVIGALATAGAGCGGGATSSTSTPAGAGTTVRVPQDAPTIQAGVDAAKPGDMVLIEQGIYKETVVVATPRLVIRGIDRNAVVLDGEFRRGDGIRVISDGVAVENLTVRNYTSNGLIFNGILGADGRVDPKRAPVQGWRGSYITAVNNQLYGVYAFAAQHGVFDHIYASGHGDSGIYVGQCAPCDALVTDSVARNNSLGYEGTNAGGNVVIVNSDFSRNRVGLAINSSDNELLAPSDGVVVAGNRVVDNNNPTTPVTEGAFGFGIAVGGALNVTVTKNLVSRNRDLGIVVTDQEVYLPADTHVTDNALRNNGIDLALIRAGGGDMTVAGNCFAGNRPARSLPAKLESVAPCDGSGPAQVSSPRRAVPPPPPGVEVRDVPPPPPQPSMPNAGTAPPAPAEGLPPVIDLATIRVPK
jgi:parallel beta-helix repeat protein